MTTPTPDPTPTPAQIVPPAPKVEANPRFPFKAYASAFVAVLGVLLAHTIPGVPAWVLVIVAAAVAFGVVFYVPNPLRSSRR